jgi:type II secretory pathway predicted ATPase ExeA
MVARVEQQPTQHCRGLAGGLRRRTGVRVRSFLVWRYNRVVEVGGECAGGRFRLVRQIGEGGMGIVYAAVDSQSGEQVAVKTVRAPGGDAIGRLKREFRALHDLRHDNLVSLGELIEDHGDWFFTMELVDGVSFLEWVRPGMVVEPSTRVATQAAAPAPRRREASSEQPAAEPPSDHGILDEQRLRHVLAQLVRGLSCLHEVGKVHRDVKPANIMVTRAGRVVLLDFGLVTELDHPTLSDDRIVGTALYMAPEQGTGQRVGPEADWYAVGCLLYEALTGRLPFEGTSAIQILMEKQRRLPPAPCGLAPTAPADLSDLCMQLLQPEPDRRPQGPSLLRMLGGQPSSGRAGARASSGYGSNKGLAMPFVGRSDELVRLRHAFDRSRAGVPAAVYVSGDSGVGKTTLVRHFTNALSVEDTNVVVLPARCYERESVPYKAVDGLIDRLARYMARLSRAEAATLVPPRAWLLLQAFPVLRSVDALAESPRIDVPDPQELRTRMFTALRQLFELLCERHPVVLVIDDLQWADADSLALLAELVRPVDAPSLLLLATWRSAGEAEAPLAGRLRTLPIAVDDLVLDVLPEQEARELAALLFLHLGGASSDVSNLGAIAQEAQGHPLFIDELVRHALAHGGEAPATVEDAVLARLQQLDERARGLLLFVAIAAAPLRLDVAARAARLEAGGISRWGGLLRVANLVRWGGAPAGETIEPYHDRVRAAVLRSIDADQGRALHRDLARAMEACGTFDAETLAIHLQAAGELAAAAVHAEEAAHEADRALAFDRAARLYRTALGLYGPTHGKAHLVTVRLADALAKAGRGAEAAQAYLDATTGASAADTLDLTRRAAQQFIVSGHIDRGLETIRVALASEGLTFPKTPRRALARLLWSRFHLRLRGLSYTSRDASEISERELACIDLCRHVALGLGTVDQIRANVFQHTGLRLALAAGERHRLALALAIEGAMLAAGSGRRTRARTARVLASADSLAREVGHPHPLAVALGARGHAAFLSGEFSKALATCSEAEHDLRERCSAVWREIAVMRLSRLRSLSYLGRLADLSIEVPAVLQEYRDRGDLFGSNSVRGAVLPLVYLAADEPDAALAEADSALRTWTTIGFHVQHYFVLLSQVSVDLYRGDGAAARTRIEAVRPRLERSMLLRIQFARICFGDARARAAVAEALVDAQARPRLLRQAEGIAKRIMAEDSSWGQPMALLVRAAVAVQHGRDHVARALLAQAIAASEAHDMAMHAAAARWRLGERTGGDTGRKLRAEADAWLRHERVAAPARLVEMLAPGFPLPGDAFVMG